MKINEKFLNEIINRLDIVSAAGRSSVEQLMLAAPQNYNFDQLLEYVTAHYLPLVEACTGNAAAIGASAYDAYRELQTGEALGAVPFTSYEQARTTAATMAFIGQACDQRDMDLLTDLLGRRMDAEVMRSYSNSLIMNGSGDPAHPKYARVPTSADPCEFCRALAGHGFFYSSKEAAGALKKFHDFCRCQVVPEFSKAAERLRVAGYDPEAYAEEWRANRTQFRRKFWSENGNGSYTKIDPTAKATVPTPEIKKPLLSDAPDPRALPAKAYGGPWNQAEDMDKFLKAMFEEGDYVGTCARFFDVTSKAGITRHVPTRGLYQRTAGQIRGILNRTHNISAAIGSYNRRYGAYVRINPLDGRGYTDLSVSRFLYTLIECDTIPLEMQYAYIQALNLPTQAIVTSGGKSLHAVVRIDAKDLAEYRERVALLQAECKAAGFPIDTTTRNPSRYMRLPGVYRGNGRQVLISTGEGARSWDDWLEWCKLKRGTN